MIGELNLHGVYVPTLLMATTLAGLANVSLARLLAVTRAYRWIWHRGLFDLASFVILLSATETLLTHAPWLIAPLR
jgi:hypothetical protein